MREVQEEGAYGLVLWGHCGGKNEYGQGLGGV